jgi:hypothetical protein
VACLGSFAGRQLPPSRLGRLRRGPSLLGLLWRQLAARGRAGCLYGRYIAGSPDHRQRIAKTLSPTLHAPCSHQLPRQVHQVQPRSRAQRVDRAVQPALPPPVSHPPTLACLPCLWKQQPFPLPADMRCSQCQLAAWADCCGRAGLPRADSALPPCCPSLQVRHRLHVVQQQQVHGAGPCIRPRPPLRAELKRREENHATVAWAEHADGRR